MYIVIKAGGELGQGIKTGTDDGTHELVAIANHSSLGGELALRAGEDFLKRLRLNQGDLRWSEAALDYANSAGAMNIPVDTLRGVVEGRRATFPVVINDEGLLKQLGGGDPEREKVVREVLLVLHEKGLLP